MLCGGPRRKDDNRSRESNQVPLSRFRSDEHGDKDAKSNQSLFAKALSSLTEFKNAFAGCTTEAISHDASGDSCESLASGVASRQRGTGIVSTPDRQVSLLSHPSGHTPASLNASDSRLFNSILVEGQNDVSHDRSQTPTTSGMSLILQDNRSIRLSPVARQSDFSQKDFFVASTAARDGDLGLHSVVGSPSYHVDDIVEKGGESDYEMMNDNGLSQEDGCMVVESGSDSDGSTDNNSGSVRMIDTLEAHGSTRHVGNLIAPQSATHPDELSLRRSIVVLEGDSSGDDRPVPNGLGQFQGAGRGDKSSDGVRFNSRKRPSAQATAESFEIAVEEYDSEDCCSASGGSSTSRSSVAVVEEQTPRRLSSSLHVVGDSEAGDRHLDLMTEGLKALMGQSSSGGALSRQGSDNSTGGTILAPSSAVHQNSGHEFDWSESSCDSDTSFELMDHDATAEFDNSSWGSLSPSPHRSPNFEVHNHSARKEVSEDSDEIRLDAESDDSEDLQNLLHGQQVDQAVVSMQHGLAAQVAAKARELKVAQAAGYIDSHSFQDSNDEGFSQQASPQAINYLIEQHHETESYEHKGVQFSTNTEDTESDFAASRSEKFQRHMQSGSLAGALDAALGQFHVDSATKQELLGRLVSNLKAESRESGGVNDGHTRFSYSSNSIGCSSQSVSSGLQSPHQLMSNAEGQSEEQASACTASNVPQYASLNRSPKPAGHSDGFPENSSSSGVVLQSDQGAVESNTTDKPSLPIVAALQSKGADKFSHAGDDLPNPLHTSGIEPLPSTPPQITGNVPPAPPTPPCGPVGPPPPLPHQVTSEIPLAPPPSSVAGNGPPPPPPPPSVSNHPSSPTPPPPVVGNGPPAPPPPPGASSGPPPPPPPPVVGNGPPAPPPPPGAGSGPPPPPPPPVVGNGPPAPPPPPGGRGGPPPPPHSQNAQGKSKALKPRKILHWKKIPQNKLQHSIFAQESAGNNISLATSTIGADLSVHSKEIEALFFENPLERKKKSAKKADPSSKSKSKSIHLLDLKRANKVGITLSRFRMKTSEICDAIVEMDDSKLGEEQVAALLKVVPTAEERETLQLFTGDTNKLGTAERIFLQFMEIPFLEARLQAFCFKLEFSAKCDSICENSSKFQKALSQIFASERLKGVFEGILAIGNFVNDGHRLGSAGGISLESALMLAEIKSSDKKISLMHYLAAMLIKSKPELLNFGEDLSESATLIDFPVDIVFSELSLLNSSHRNMKVTIEGLNLDIKGSNSDSASSIGPFVDNMLKFLELAEERLNSANEQVQSLRQGVERAALYFGEDPTSFVLGKCFHDLHRLAKLLKMCGQESAPRVVKRRGSVFGAEMSPTNSDSSPKASQSEQDEQMNRATPLSSSSKSTEVDSAAALEKEKKRRLRERRRAMLGKG